MFRKSRRTATTTYRRRRLTWDETTPSVATHDDHDEMNNSILTGKVLQKGKKERRLVTPSPNAASTLVQCDEGGRSQHSQSNKSPAIKQLFAKKRLSRNKRTARLTDGATSVSPSPGQSCANDSQNFLFPFSKTDDIATSSTGTQNGGSSIHRKRGSKRRMRDRKPLHLATKSAASFRKSKSRLRHKYTTGDSLASLVSQMITHPSKRSTPTKSNGERRIQAQRHPVHLSKMGDGTTKQEKDMNASKNMKTQCDTFEERTSETTKKRCREKSGKKNGTSVPVKFIPLLASLATPSIKMARARSTSEILNEFHRKKEDFKLTFSSRRVTRSDRLSYANHNSRKRLPRACKNTRNSRKMLPRACKNKRNANLQKEFLTHEDIEKELELDSDDGDEADDDSEDEEWVEGRCRAKVPSSTDVTPICVNISPPESRLKPRPRKLFSLSSDQNRAGGLTFPVIDNETEMLPRSPKKRRCGSDHNLDSSLHQDVDIVSQKAHRSKSSGAMLSERSSGEDINPNQRLVKEKRSRVHGGKLQPDDFRELKSYKDSLYRERTDRRFQVHDAGDIGTPKSRISSSGSRTDADALRVKDSHLQLVSPSRSSSSQRAQRKRHKKFSMEEYSVHSSQSRSKKSEIRPVVDEIQNSPIRPSISLEDYNSDARVARKKASNNSRESIRKTKHNKLQSDHKFSPSEISIKNNEEAGNMSSRIGTSFIGSSSPRRHSTEEHITLRQQETNATASKKRVRFDSSTTTFSVKIKIKTNLNARGHKRGGRSNGQSIALPSSLDESAVQAIANQVTQACLSQATTNMEPDNCSGFSRRGRDIDVNFDVNNDNLSTSHSSEGTSNSNQSGNANEQIEEEKRNKTYSDSVSEMDPHLVEARSTNCDFSRRDSNDARSVTSELTSDWNRPSRFDHHQIYRKSNSDFVASDSHGSQNNFDDDFRGQSDVENIKSTDHDQDYTGTSIPNKKRSPRGVSNYGRNGDMRSCSSTSRRQRIWGCSDSLAGSGFESKVSGTEGSVSFQLPREVSLQNSSLRPKGLFSSNFRSDKRKYASVCNEDDDESMKKETIKSSRSDYLLSTPNPRSNSRVVPFAPTYRCGMCKGCRRTLDCQTCDVCLQKLQYYGSQLSPTEDICSPCLLRRCQRTCRVGCVDSLLGLKPSPNSTSANQKEKHCTDKLADTSNMQVFYSKDPVATKSSTLGPSPKPASRNTKAPWEEGDDWTVDYSYLSEPEYRQSWSIASNNSGRHKVHSSTRSLPAHSGWLTSHQKRPMMRFGDRVRTSLSSISESIPSKEKSKQMPSSLSTSANKLGKKRGKGRGEKRKRDHLHGLALPSTSMDGCSVTSWRENRKCLRALMEYDEADQEWG